MSRVVRSSLTVSPKLRLSQALSDFNADLDDAQKAEFANYRTDGDVKAAMQLTVEIDEASTAQATGERRLWGSRVTNFLLGIQQLATVADVAVGGSQIPVASGVWFAVRVALLAATKYSPRIEKLSELFMSQSRVITRIQALEGSCSQSSRMRDLTIEYYLIIVRLCHEILKLSKSSLLTRVFSNFSETSYSEDLEKVLRDIKTEIAVEIYATKKQEDTQRAKLMKQKDVSLAIKKAKSQEIRKNSILKACSNHDHLKTWRQIKQQGNTRLYSQNADYKRWRSSRHACTLVYSGKLGSGKSVLFANIVGDLCQLSDAKISYFFCKHDVQDSLKARTIIGSLARQILTYPDDDTRWEYAAGAVPEQYDLQDVFQLLQQTASAELVHFVLDGIDEMHASERRMLIDGICHIQQYIHLVVCISTKQHPRDLFGNRHPPTELIVTSMPPQNPDLDTFIEAELHNRIEEGDLVVSEPQLIQDVGRTLSAKADGMFLWVFLQIKQLCLMDTDYDIRQALDELPATLAETYSRLLNSKVEDGSKSSYRQRMFELICVAIEPMTRAEIKEALSVMPGITEFEPSRQINDIDKVIRACAGLVIVDEEEDTVRLIHHSAEQFLTTTDEQEHSVNVTAATLKISEAILTYLNYNHLDRQLVPHKTAPRVLNTDEIPSALIARTLPLATRFVHSRSRSWNKARPPQYTCPVDEDSSFADYAQRFWDAHLLNHQPSQTELKLLKHLVQKGRLDLDAKNNLLTPLQRAIDKQNYPVIEIVLRYGAPSLDAADVLDIASTPGNGRILDLLVQYSPDKESLFLKAILHPSTSLLESVLRADEGMTNDLLNNPHKMLDDFTALSFAVDRRLVNIVQSLLEDHRISPTASGPVKMLRRSYESSFLGSGPPMSLQRLRPFEYAVETGFVEAVGLFSAKYIIKNEYHSPVAKTRLWRSAVREWSGPWKVVNRYSIPAASCGEIIRVLLEQNIISIWDNFNVDAKTITPLMMAAKHGREEIIKVILEFDIEQVNHVEYNRTGKVTAWDMAKSEDIRTLIETYGGKSSTEID